MLASVSYLLSSMLREVHGIGRLVSSLEFRHVHDYSPLFFTYLFISKPQHMHYIAAIEQDFGEIFQRYLRKTPSTTFNRI